LVPVDNSFYDVVYHLGFRRVPDKPLPYFIAHQVGLGDIDKISYYYPKFETLNGDYLVLAPRGKTNYKKLFQDKCLPLRFKVKLWVG